MCMLNGITGGLKGRTDALCIILEEMMTCPTTKPENAPAKPKATADQTLHIEEPWSMTWMEYVDEMLGFLKTQIGPDHPLHRKKLYVSAVNKDADAWYVEGEKEDLYAIVYFSGKKRYAGKSMPNSLLNKGSLLRNAKSLGRFRL